MLLGPNVFILQNIFKMLIARQRKLHCRAIMNFNFTFQRWEIIHDHCV